MKCVEVVAVPAIQAFLFGIVVGAAFVLFSLSLVKAAQDGRHSP